MMALSTRLGRWLALAGCILLMAGCATPEVPGIHQRDRDRWVETEDATFGAALALCVGGAALLSVTGLVVSGTLWYARKRSASRKQPDE